MAELDLEKLRQLDASGTPAPWRVRPISANAGGCRDIQAALPGGNRTRRGFHEIAGTYGLHDDDQDQANAALIVELRNQLPAVLAALTRAELVEKALARCWALMDRSEGRIAEELYEILGQLDVQLGQAAAPTELVQLRVFRCPCGGNVLRKVGMTYTCNACGEAYEGTRG